MKIPADDEGLLRAGSGQQVKKRSARAMRYFKKEWME